MVNVHSFNSLFYYKSFNWESNHSISAKEPGNLRKDPLNK